MNGGTSDPVRPERSDTAHVQQKESSDGLEICTEVSYLKCNIGRITVVRGKVNQSRRQDET